jgi:TM2 domain-containing membrane protein YozV
VVRAVLAAALVCAAVAAADAGEKSVSTATTLSWWLPGGGQFYLGNVGKGIRDASTELLFLAGAAGSVAVGISGKADGNDTALAVGLVGGLLFTGVAMGCRAVFVNQVHEDAVTLNYRARFIDESMLEAMRPPSESLRFRSRQPGLRVSGRQYLGAGAVWWGAMGVSVPIYSAMRGPDSVRFARAWWGKALTAFMGMALGGSSWLTGVIIDGIDRRCNFVAPHGDGGSAILGFYAGVLASLPAMLLIGQATNSALALISPLVLLPPAGAVIGYNLSRPKDGGRFSFNSRLEPSRLGIRQERLPDRSELTVYDARLVTVRF